MLLLEGRKKKVELKKEVQSWTEAQKQKILFLEDWKVDNFAFVMTK